MEEEEKRCEEHGRWLSFKVERASERARCKRGCCLLLSKVCCAAPCLRCLFQACCGLLRRGPADLTESSLLEVRRRLLNSVFVIQQSFLFAWGGLIRPLDTERAFPGTKRLL